MRDDILTYRQLCDNENIQTIQRGMNYRLNPNYSVILMSQRSNAPYDDKIYEDGLSIEYEGHDVSRNSEFPFPKNIDQPEITRTGKFTQNGLFKAAAERFQKTGEFEKVRIYEKIFSGVWSDRGFFKLSNFKIINDGKRNVFRFMLISLSDKEMKTEKENAILRQRSRIIPTQIKKEVWARDQGKCVICGAKDELHFDHDLPFSKGGASITTENVRILRARHNLQKSNKIE
jgi:hypothetical protein